MATDPLLKGKAGHIDLIEVPPMRYLAIEGQGAPESAAFAQAVQALYTLAYGARFAGKALGHDEKVGPLEGLWWAEDYAAYTEDGRREEWAWRMMIRAPSWLTEATFTDLRAKAAAKKQKDAPGLVPVLDRVALFDLDEGLCLQALHLGPYSDEAPLIAGMHDGMPAQGLEPSGLHHEIYLSDPRRVAPEKLKTLIRQPVRRV